MKQSRALLFGLALVGPILGQSVQAEDVYTIDITHAYAHFGVSHLGYSTMYGRIDTTGGSFRFDQDSLTGSIEVMLDPASIDTGHEERDNHLRSPDFLNVVEFPEMRFVADNVVLTGTGGMIDGELTLHGQTRPVSLTVTGWRCADNPMSGRPTCGFDAVGELQRSEFGMRYAVPAIGDTLQLMIGIEGVRAD